MSLVSAWPDSILVANPAIDNAFRAAPVELHGAQFERGWTMMTAADFTDDGVTDILGTATDNSWWLRVNDGVQVFETRWGDAISGSPNFLSEADFDNDGWFDIASFDKDTGDIWVSLNSVDGFKHERWSTFTTSTTWRQLIVADFTGDGLIDILGGESGGSWWLAKNTDGTSFQNQHWGRFPAVPWQNVKSGDFDGDGINDIAARAEDSTWWIWKGSASGFDDPNYWGHWRMRGDWFDVGVGDFNNDDRDDLIGRTDDGRIWVGSSTGDSFQTQSWGTGWVHSANWTDVEIVDLNHDGLLDQVAHAKDDTWWFARNMGGKFRNEYWLRFDESNAVIVSDFQRDEAINLQAVLSQGRLTTSNDAVHVSLSANGQLVVSGTGQITGGLEFASASGSLVPISNNNEASRGPFSHILANDRRLIVLVILPSPYVLDGPLALDIGWHEIEKDLTVRYGYGTALHAIVVEKLNSSTGISQADLNLSAFYSS